MARRIIIIVAVCSGIAAVAGLVILMLPYRTTNDFMPSLVSAGVVVPCKPPMIDAFTSEDGDTWINYTPEGGTSFDGPRTGDANCYPESFRRTVIGATTTIAGICVLSAALLIERRIRRTQDESADESMADDEPASGDDPPEPTLDPDAEPDADPEVPAD